MVLKIKDIDTALMSLGFKKEENHHTMYYYIRLDGTHSKIQTKISQGAKEYDDGLIALMAKQINLPKKIFVQHVRELNLTRQKYEELAGLSTAKQS